MGGVAHQETETPDLAWDPAVFLDGENRITAKPEPGLGTYAVTLGAHLLTDCLGWMLDTRLRDKKLDVRLKGMGRTFGGKYEDEEGFFWLASNAKVKRTKPTIQVIIGLHEVKRHVPIEMIHPERTTVQKRFTAPDGISGGGTEVVRISRAIGQRVVIIGPDNYGADWFVGKYGIVSPTQSTDPADVWIIICPGQGKEYDGRWAWMNEIYLCRSIVPPQY